MILILARIIGIISVVLLGLLVSSLGISLLIDDDESGASARNAFKAKSYFMAFMLACCSIITITAIWMVCFIWISSFLSPYPIPFK